MRRVWSATLASLLGLTLTPGCFSDESPNTSGSSCEPGLEDCPCDNGTCLGSLVCNNGLCETPGTSSGQSSTSEASTTTPTSTGPETSTTSTSGSTSAASTGTPDTTGNEDCIQLVFVTNNRVSGGFLPVSVDRQPLSADELCQAEADAVSALGGRTYRAVLSTGNMAARDILDVECDVHLVPDDGGEPGGLVATAQNWWTGDHEQPINRTAGGFFPVGGGTAYAVWTGTNPDGTSSGSDCNGWNGGSTMGTAGRSTADDDQWISSEDILECQSLTEVGLYCLEEPSVP